MATTNIMQDKWERMEILNHMGLEKLLYSSKLPFHIYATYSSDERSYGVAFSYPDTIRVDIAPFQNLKKLKVDIYTDGAHVNCKMLVIQLLSPAQKETFSWLCESIISEVKELSTEEEMVKKAISALDKWRNLFDKAGSSGLSTALQQGLYGELGLLQKLIAKKVFSVSEAVEFWVGSEPALRDFQGDTWAIEVKTSAGNNPQGVIISSERQLDESLFDNLYLYHTSIEVSKKNGESLPDRVAKVRALIESDSMALGAFYRKLVNYGYFFEDSALYENRKYRLREDRFYKIEKDFPRIKETELRDGVGDISYKIILSACTDYRKSESEVFNTIKVHD